MLTSNRLIKMGVDQEDVTKIMAFKKKAVGLSVNSNLSEALEEINLVRYQKILEGVSIDTINELSRLNEEDLITIGIQEQDVPAMMTLVLKAKQLMN